MFVRAQRSGKRTYLLIVENEWAGGKVRQKVLRRLGWLDGERVRRWDGGTVKRLDGETG